MQSTFVHPSLISCYRSQIYDIVFVDGTELLEHARVMKIGIIVSEFNNEITITMKIGIDGCEK